MEITFFGHSTFLLKINNTSILFDPYISGNPLSKSIDINSIKADYVLISHGHRDHMLDAYDIAKNNDATIVSNFEIVGWYGKQGYEKGQPLNHGGSWKFDFGEVKYVNAVHTSSMPDGSYGAFLPIGDCFTMGVEDAVIASKMIKCDKIIAMHYDTFPLIEVKNKEAAKKAFSDEGKELVFMEIGGTISI